MRGLIPNCLISINSGVTKRITKDTLIAQEIPGVLGTLPRMRTKTKYIIIPHPPLLGYKVGDSYSAPSLPGLIIC